MATGIYLKNGLGKEVEDLWNGWRDDYISLWMDDKQALEEWKEARGRKR